MSEWISVEERLPELGETVLVWVEAERYMEDEHGQYRMDASEVDLGETQNNGGELFLDHYSGPFGDSECVTHWMPLPPPPSTPC
ncbi:DUF551 domain-containing protein [Stutzerimonas stutzeri]|uniref:DUF551 domain-containing protein n=1 Tax=Stutzerimonas stutzeri TaxID=316 RepID=UPI0018AAC9FB|nr:DUF551 domain-containing protein [Stutzerimonas stutzeri]QPI08302.1 DUF551 domain-containing protein [Stutzerimonas stutzeri]